jgi:riboflavin biosynthesis pyrimidine reductase
MTDETPVLELYPGAGVERPLRGLHLGDDVRSRPRPSGSYVYTGYIASIDGKIALEGSSGAPKATRNDRDWRLFQELMLQSDVVLASGRYVRDKKVGGTVQSIIPAADDPASADLIAWRTEQDLPARPALAIVTSKAGFDPEVAASLADEVIAVLGEEPDAETAAALSDAGITVVTAGRGGRVAGDLLLDALAEHGHRVVFSAAGPQVFRTLVPVIDALYLTVAGRLLAGRSYSTLLEGDELDVPPNFDLGAAYLDPEGPGGAVQLFLEFDRQQ